MIYKNLLLILLFFKLYWIIVDLQCCVSQMYSKVFSYTHTQIHCFFKKSFLIYRILHITEYWLEFSVLYSTSLLVLCLINHSVCVLSSQFIPPPSHVSPWVNCQHLLDHRKSKRVPEKKTCISALLIMPKPLTVWITINCGKCFKRWEYQTTWPASWETYMQVKKQQLELNMEQQTGSKLRKEVSKWAVVICPYFSC